MTRWQPVLVAAAIGTLLAGAEVVGLSLATTSPPSAGPVPLALDDWCRHVHGPRSAAYEPRALDGWRCSVWRHGVWGLELADLGAACHLQRGDRATLVAPEPVRATTRRALLCTE